MLICTFHIGDSLVPLYAEPFEDAQVVPTMLSGLSSVYVQLAKQPMRSWLDRVAPGWTPPLVMIGWSAGCFSIRDWLRNDPDAGLIDVAVLLDGLHSGGATCNQATIQGVLDMAASPSKLVVVTHTEIDPQSYASTTECAELMRGSGARVYGYQGDDAAAHVRQVREVGPQLMRTVVKRWLVGPSWWMAGLVGGACAVVSGLVTRCVLQRRK